MKVRSNQSVYAQCNFCLGRIEIFDIKGKTPLVVSLCKSCIEKINSDVETTITMRNEESETKKN